MKQEYRFSITRNYCIVAESKEKAERLALITAKKDMVYHKFYILYKKTNKIYKI